MIVATISACQMIMPFDFRVSGAMIFGLRHIRMQQNFLIFKDLRAGTWM